MTNWTKIENQGNGRRARATPAVYRNRETATLVIPHTMVTSSRVDVFSDGSGRLAFRMHDGGDRSVYKNNGLSMRINIPVEFVGRIPNGTTNVDLAKDGDLLVLDLKSIGGDA